ncbi:GNAT family N-acetyltransferase [Sphaerospermopsis sp. FACHB-1194]|uniref:GNAT family N-acetyltransferase n=1 Tax=unclassified Sphaerospermopsis TaxID=2646443 RepID=UPI0016806C75|nr:GNAT family N-acetyltransferase [Sphaerospermopsis sp. FACHB-1194]
MNMCEDIVFTPWDSRAFGIKTFEIPYISENDLRNTLEKIKKQKSEGHYTIKINPLAPKKTLHEFGFYYCDTLIEPYCTSERLLTYQREGIDICEPLNIEDISEIVYGAFTYDRFHRDFNINQNLADLRYDLWLRDLWQSKKVFSLMFYGSVVGFWAYSDNKILLHALSKEYRGKGLSKYFWSVACKRLLEKGYQELTSSISISNVAVLNLYLSLGFKFRNSVDIYHLLVE